MTAYATPESETADKTPLRQWWLVLASYYVGLWTVGGLVMSEREAEDHKAWLEARGALDTRIITLLLTAGPAPSREKVNEPARG